MSRDRRTFTGALRTALALLMSGVLTYPALAAAQALDQPVTLGEQAPLEDVQAAEDSARQLSGHVFLPSELVRHPFTAAYADINLGYGYARATGTRYSLQGLPNGKRNYDLGELQQSFELQLRVLPWWALRAGGALQLEAGSTSSAVLALGALASWNVSVGTTVSFKLFDLIQVGGTLDAYLGPSYSLNLVGGLTRAIRERQVDLSGFLTTTTSATIAPGGVAAIALHRALGVGAHVQYLHGVQSLENKPGTTEDVAIGAVVDFDINALAKVPIGAVAAYKIKIPIHGEDSHVANAVDLGVFYQHRHSLVLGPEVGAYWFTLVLSPRDVDNAQLRLFPGTRDVNATALRGQLVMRYYW